uniref:Uncharacterized protein n=1 Tax=Romanomermis culicivorax TaxID=13658 RepID=A0A915JIP6_ROMCU
MYKIYPLAPNVDLEAATEFSDSVVRLCCLSSKFRLIFAIRSFKSSSFSSSSLQTTRVACFLSKILGRIIFGATERSQVGGVVDTSAAAEAPVSKMRYSLDDGMRFVTERKDDLFIANIVHINIHCPQTINAVVERLFVLGHFF